MTAASSDSAAASTSVHVDKRIIHVTGLPRAGSTLLCQLLGQHPEVYSVGHSSPLAHALQNLRAQLSDDSFLLSQLDVDFDLTYRRLENAFRGFINGWFMETDRRFVVDKNRGWLSMIETLAALVPDFRMLVCVRDLAQIYGSIEAQHQRTLLLDFPDDLAPLSRYARADKLFGPDGVIGRPLQSIAALKEVPESLQEHVYFVVFEHLMQEPDVVMGNIHDWLGMQRHTLDPAKLDVKRHESDSHYRFKYPHSTRTRIEPPKQHEIPQRIAQDIRRNFGWYLDLFYPGRNDS